MSLESRVSIRLGVEAFQLAKTYDIRLGIFDQPSAFGLSIGGFSRKELIRRYPPETPFSIAVENREQFSGYTDGFDTSGDANESEFSIKGRDVIKELFHSDIEKEESFEGKTHRELVARAIEEVNLRRPFTGERVRILSSNAENRRVISGQSSLDAEDDTSDVALNQIAGDRGSAFPVLRTKVAETFFSLVRRHLDAVGLFLWCSASGDIVVGLPNHKQPASCKLRRGAGKSGGSPILTDRYGRDNTPRYSDIAIYGRTTGKKKERITAKGAYTDDVLLAQGHVWTKVYRDAQVTSTAHAEHVARKKLAEGRRAGFHLEYTVEGHTTTSLLTGKNVCWAPDTVVFVDDDDLGLQGNYWIEQVQYTRNARVGTITTLRLLEPDVLIFGDNAL